ncbi:MAG: RDD family protein [Nitrospinae bacterium]|nr:RDD family protein [Nitrospinota bacterium]
MTTPSGEGPPAGAPAGLWRRLFAGLFDGLFLLTVAGVLLLEMPAAVYLAERFSGTSAPPLEEQGPFWLALGIGWCMLSAIALPLSYFTVCEGAWGQTLGKRAFGIVVVSTEGQPISYSRALARLMTLPYSLLPAGLGFLWAALPPSKRAWHDYLTGTRVIAIF